MIPDNFPVLKDPDTGRYIIKFDASLYKDSNCRRRLYLKLFGGYRHGDKDFKMEYGTAFHKFLQLYYSGKTLEESSSAGLLHYMNPDIHIPETDWRSIAHLANCMNQYNDFWRKTGDLLVPGKTPSGEPTLECRFAFPYYRTDLVEVLLCGTIDFIGVFASQFPTIADHKTTSLTQIESYLNSYEISVQLMLYKFIHDRLFGGDINAMINGVFLSRTNKNNFKRSRLFTFNGRQMLLFERRLKTTVVETVNAFEWMVKNDWNPENIDNMFGPNYTCCDEKYGMCEFLPACLQPSSVEQNGILEMEFTRKYYDPLQFQT